MQRLLYREARVTKARYKTNKNAWAAGAEGKYGVKFGLEVHKITKGKELISAQYLGASRGGERRYVPYTQCVK